MPLNSKTKQQLKAKAHTLNPIVMIGNNGLTDAVLKEINQCLNDHELIKIRIHSNDRDLRRALFNQLCHSVKAELIQVIGTIGVIYRKNIES